MEVFRLRTDNSALSQEDVGKVLESARAHKEHYIILLLGFNMGDRVNEHCKIEPKNIDFDNNTIRVWDQKKDQWTDKNKVLHDNKAKKWRLQHPPASVMKEVQHYYASKKVYGDYLFDFSWITLERIIQKYTRLALGSARSWHCVRHTFITQSLNNGRSIAWVCAETGDSEATISRVYHNLSPEQVRKEADIDIYAK